MKRYQVLLLVLLFLSSLPLLDSHKRGPANEKSSLFWESELSCEDIVLRLALQDKIDIKLTREGEEVVGIKVNNITVTGGDHYPLELILANLSIGNREIHNWQGKQVLSLGEGHSNLLPHLRSMGVSIWGLDTWYDYVPLIPNDNALGKRIHQYVQTHKNFLINGSAAAIPLEGNSIDIVVSHKLVNNIEVHQVLKVVDEAIRVLRANGEIRIFGISERKKSILEYHLLNYGDRFDINFYEYEEPLWKPYLMILKSRNETSPMP